MRKAIFIDKDGTLIRDNLYNVKPELISITDNTVDDLRVLQQQGFLLIIISNQHGIAHGFFPKKSLKAVGKKIAEFLLEGIKLDGFYYCPHHPHWTKINYRAPCTCWKPEPGLLLKAAEEHRINLHSSWKAGDILSDMEAGNRAGCKTILIDNENETEWLIKKTHAVPSIDEAAGIIIRESLMK